MRNIWVLRVRPSLSTLALVGTLATALWGCEQQGFQCGIALDSKGESVSRCSRNLEVCVCETNLCAKEVSPSECKSGFKYVEQPFVPAALAETCVEGLLRPNWMVRSDPASSQLPLCTSVDLGTSGADMSLADLPSSDAN